MAGRSNALSWRQQGANGLPASHSHTTRKQQQSAVARQQRPAATAAATTCKPHSRPLSGRTEPSQAAPASKPLLQLLLQHLKDQVDDLLPAGAFELPNRQFVSETASLQQTVNDLAATIIRSPTKAVDQFHHNARLLGVADRKRLLTTPTTTPASPTLVPLLYYAVASGSRQVVHCLLDHGASPNLHQDVTIPAPASLSSSVQRWQHIPVLALAVAQGDHGMVHLLLQRGADPLAIPIEMYLPSMQKEGLHALPQPDPRKAAAGAAWCLAEGDRLLLQGQLDPADESGLTMQYWLTRALKLPLLTSSALQQLSVSNLMRAPELRLAVPGQEIASMLMYHHVVVHSMQDKTRAKPLVLALAGPPGHGKTLLGQMMQAVVPGAAYCFVDCSKVHHVVDPWGAGGCFQNSKTRPAFAATLFANSRKPCVVILDEFEKMRGSVQNALLSVLQEGRYLDMLTQSEVVCNNTIFLLTTNAADQEILDYWTQNNEQLLNANMQPSALMQMLRPLFKGIEAAIAAQISRSLTSRLHGVVPFVPFTETDQVIVVQQELLVTQSDLAMPPDEADNRLHGNIKLQLHDQPKVCRAIAQEAYDASVGARALRNEVKRTVDDAVKVAWLDEVLVNEATADLVAAEDAGSTHTIQYGSPDYY